LPQFTDGELDVMRVLWDGGELKPAEIQKRYPQAIKNAALRSYLTILLEKGHVTRRLQGKAYFYKAKTPRTSALQNAFRQLVNAFAGGSTPALMRTLLDSESISPKELEELNRLADQSPTAPPTNER